MNLARRAVVLSVCTLAACAQVPQGRPSAPPVRASAPRTLSPAPVRTPVQAASAAHAAPPAPMPRAVPGMTSIGDMLRRIGAQSQAAANADEQRLRQLGAARSVEQRLHLSYLLLARPAPTVDQANQALILLGGIDHAGVDPGTRQFVRVLQRLARQTLGLAQLRAELGRANRQVADLQDKIAQIKSLEVQLQDRSKQGPER